ncbi:MAG: hypothetical protein Q8N53_24075 [Longimicrobiales bacterium]|nr:hypothetical protein [Longimicrobiales bacterium]
MRLERGLLAVVVCTGGWGLARFAARERELLAEIKRLAVPALRAQVQDAMVGNPFPIDSLPGIALGGVTYGPAGLIWVVMAKGCPGCLEDVDDWNMVANSGEIVTALVLVGASKDEMAFANRVLSDSTAVIGLTQEVGEAWFGWMMPNTQMVVDRNGYILSADSRASGPECGWNFSSQVGAQLGLLAPSEIRGRPKAPGSSVQTKEIAS